MGTYTHCQRELLLQSRNRSSWRAYILDCLFWYCLRQLGHQFRFRLSRKINSHGRPQNIECLKHGGFHFNMFDKGTKTNWGQQRSKVKWLWGPQTNRLVKLRLYNHDIIYSREFDKPLRAKPTTANFLCVTLKRERDKWRFLLRIPLIINLLCY
jgi:hypothetical protein